MPFFTGKPFDEAAYEEHLKNLEAALDKLERLYLKDDPFINGDEITIADLLGKILKTGQFQTLTGRVCSFFLQT